MGCDPFKSRTLICGKLFPFVTEVSWTQRAGKIADYSSSEEVVPRSAASYYFCCKFWIFELTCCEIAAKLNNGFKTYQESYQYSKCAKSWRTIQVKCRCVLKSFNNNFPYNCYLSIFCSQAIVADRTIYVAGQLGMDPKVTSENCFSKNCSFKTTDLCT